MTDQERINQQLQRQIDAQNARIDTVLAKVDMAIVELQQQREDIRRAQEKHDAEMHEMNQRFYDKLDDNFKVLSNQIHSNFVQTMVGFGAIAAAVGGIVIAAFK